MYKILKNISEIGIHSILSEVRQDSRGYIVRCQLVDTGNLCIHGILLP